MSDAVLISLISAVASIATVLITALSSRRITLLEKNTNSIKDALVKKTAEVAFVKGVKAGQGKP